MEFILAEWHIDPIVISDTWTDEMLQLMLEKLVDRKERLNRTLSEGDSAGDEVPDETFFSQLGSRVKRA